MAHPHKVLRSIEMADGGRCVDLFRRPDATYGFEEYRLDAEDGRGWFPIGGHAGGVFATETDALDEARARVVWLEDAMPSGRENGGG